MDYIKAMIWTALELLDKTAPLVVGLGTLAFGMAWLGLPPGTCIVGGVLTGVGYAAIDEYVLG